MKSLNIALLHYSCPPVVGGVEEVLREQAYLFHRYGHRIKILSGAGERFSAKFDVEINPILGSRNRRILNAHREAEEGDTAKIEAVSGEIHRYLVKALSGADILIAHNVMSMHYNLPLTMALIRLAEDDDLPIIAWNHDSPYFYEDYPPYLDDAPWNVIGKSQSGIRYVVISESRKRQFARLFGSDERITVIPNGIDPIRFFRLSPTTLRLIQEQNFFKGDLLMMQPSRLHPRKNIELSIRVIHALREMQIHARLLVTGAYDPHEPKSVEYYNRLKSLIGDLDVEEDVLIMAEYAFRNGRRLTPSRITIRDLYLISDILFLPSSQEGFGIPLLEAGMIKLPIVCSRIPPFEEIGEEDVCFFDLDESPGSIARRIVDFTSGLGPHRMFSRTIRDYAWDNIYRFRLSPLLESVAGR